MNFLQYQQLSAGHVSRPASWKDVTQDQLRHWRGNFCGLYVPELAFPGTVDPRTGITSAANNGRTAHGLNAGLLFTTHYGNYPASMRQAILRAYTAAGHVHFPINISDAPNQWGYSGCYPPVPSWDGPFLNRLLREIWEAGCIPCCVGIGLYDEEGLAAMQAMCDLLDDPRMVQIFIPGAEMNDGVDADTQEARVRNAALVFPWATRYVWFTPQHGAIRVPEPDSWMWMRDHGITGQLFQTDSFTDPAVCLNDVDDQLARLGGYFDRPDYGGYWGPIQMDLVLHETQAYPAFWDAKPTSAIDTYNRTVLAAAYDQVRTDIRPGSGATAYQGRLIGYCNGGGA